MASSLRRQVEALRHASSGTSSGYIQRKKGKPSLLLTPDQAADVDLPSVRETAVMALQRLEAVDQDFSPFQATLFSKEAEGTLRDLQTKESNDRIDRSVSAFLALLSPHFSSREAHFCLEYLIRHYKVYQYNVDAVVECCLPWHDTLAFARMVQLLSLKGSRWEFLIPVQKTGSPLPREAIARRCARDFGLLRFLCVSARSSAARAASSSGAESSVSAATAAGRAKLFSFYAAVVVEALASLGSASEPLLRALVPTVVHGLSATKSPEYQMASYMILSALSGKGSLSPEVTSTALTALVCKPCQGGLEPSLLCALAVAQTQVGFSSKKDSSSMGGAPLTLPTPAFKKLSGMESLPGVLAGLAQKFDATAFLWLLLQSFVQHLPDEDSEHGKSLTRLCTYPFWPSHSLPRLVKRLVDRLIRSYLTVTLEGFKEGKEVDDGPERRRRSTAMKKESQRVLRVLGQRFPQEVDSAVAKISRNVAKAKAASLQEEGGSGDENGDTIKAARQEAALTEEALSSLLVSTFAGAELAQRLPLEQLQEEDVSTMSGQGAAGGVHGSLMVALEHSSGAVRARAVEQLSRAMSTADVADAAGESAAVIGGEDLSPALLRRLQDEDPEVVLAITGSDYLVQQVLLRPPPCDPRSEDDDEVTGVSELISAIQRAAVVTSACAAAAVPWLSALSEARPKHPVASSGRVLSGLLRLAAAAGTTAATVSCRDIGEEGRAVAKQSRDAALSLFLECLPGPSAIARVKLAQQLASASVSSSGDDVPKESDAAAATSTGKACKKAMRAVCRAAVEAFSGLFADELFAGLGTVLAQDGESETKVFKSPSKNTGKKSKAVDAMDVEGGAKSKGLKAMGDEICDLLATALFGASKEDSKMEEWQVLSRTFGAGGRWLVLESVSRAVSLASASSSTGTQKARMAAKAAASSLAALLACVATFELDLRPHAFDERVDVESAGAVGAAGILRYLRVCATHLPKPERPWSLHTEDHLSQAHVAAQSAFDDTSSASGAGAAAVTTSPLLGDVLVSVLKATAAVPERAGNAAVWGAVSAVIVEGYERRPLPALAAVAINAVSRSESGGESRRSARQHKRGGVDAKVVVATRALCVAATFVQATAEATVAGGKEEDEDRMAAAEKDIVAVFPAALLAVASDDKGLRDSGNLFISTVAARGDALGVSPATTSSSPTKKGSKKSKSGAPAVVSEVGDSEVFPPLTLRQQPQDEVLEPSPLMAPTLASVVRLASALAGRNQDSPLNALELSRHLSSMLVSDDDVTRYLVAWAAQLGWRDSCASARLLECLTWAKAPMRECCLPLLSHCLDSEHVRNDTNNCRLLKLLLRVTLTSPAGTAPAAAVKPDKTGTKSPKKTPRSKKGKEKTGDSTVVAASMAAPVFESVEAEKLMHRALRTPGQAQTLALRALSSSSAKITASSDEEGASSAVKTAEDAVRQRRELVLTIVEVGLAGADGSMTAAAARSLPARPCDLAAILSGLVPTSCGTATSSKARKRQPAAGVGVTPNSDAVGGESAWVSTLGGIVELAQALCGPPSVSPYQQHQPSQKGSGRSTGDESASAAVISAEGWDWAAPLELARPLFDVLPALLAVATTKAAPPASSSLRTDSTVGSSVVDAAEYALWLTMDVIGGVLRRWGKGAVGGGGGSAAAERLYKKSQAGDDAETVLTCVRENPSPQTRNSGLALLSRMATLFPAQMASRLRTLLDTVCAAAAGSEGFSNSGGDGGARAALRQTQKAVQSVVPALKAHGAGAGVGAHFVVKVFVDALDEAPVHARRTLFSTLIDSLGEKSLAIVSALLLRRAVSLSLSCDGDVDGAGGEGEEKTTALVEFVHQTVHCSGAEAQVRTLVGLLQTSHRLSVNTAERCGKLSGQSLKDAIGCFAQDSVHAEEGKVDYLQLSLEQPQEATATESTKTAPAPAFMTMDLRALSDVPGDAEGAKKKAERAGMGKFLEGILAFVRNHLVSRPLVMAVAAAAERGANGMGERESQDEGIQEGFLLLCEELLLLLRTLSACDRSSSSNVGGSSEEPSWSTLQDLAYGVFETLQSLLSVPSFVVVTQELLQHQDPHLRRKALQMFTQRLDPAGGGSGGALRLALGEESLFVEMVPSLRSVAMGKKAGGSLSATEEDEAVEAGLEEVMGPSAGVADAMDEEEGDCDMAESAVNRQTALLSLDVLARVLGRRHQDAFVCVLDDVTEIVAGEGPSALPGVGESGADGILPLRASAFLLLATLCAVLGVRAFPRLPHFFPAMLQALESQTSTSAAAAGGGGRSLLWTSALSAVATVAASLPSFLSPYLGRILAVALQPAAAAAAVPGSGGSAVAGSKQAADRVLSLLAAGVEPRLLVPAVCGAYTGCVESVLADEERVVVAARSVARLLAYVQEIVAGLEKEAASAALPQFTRLLTLALDFRRQHAYGSSAQIRASAELVESEASSSLVSLVMKLSEVELRPLFLHLCEWKAGVSGGHSDPKATLGALDRRLSFYRVLDGLAGALKSILTPYFAHVLTDCCDDMEAASSLAASASNGSSSSKNKRKRGDRHGKEAANKRKRRKTLSSGDLVDGEEEDDDDDVEEEEGTMAELRWRRSAASRLVLSALRRCFQSDRSGFVNKARFDLLLPAVVAQLDCGSDFSAGSSGSGGETEGTDEVSSCRLHAEELVGPCLAQLASASGKDALWKAMANAVLMKTRSKRAGVRVAALVSLRQCFEVIGEEFLALLPECLPFLSELLEDGHPETKMMANRAHDEEMEGGIKGTDALDSTRSGATLAIGDDLSLGDTSIATVEDFSTPANTQTLQSEKEIIDNLRKENDELRRHIKRRTQALDTIRRSYIIDVDRLKRGLRDQVEGKPPEAHNELDETALGGIPSLDFRPVLELFAPTGNKLQVSPCGECGGTLEIIHYDEKEIVKLRSQIDILREELAENGKALGYSQAVAETYRLKAETSSAEFSELNNMLLREMRVLKDKLVDAGPEVVMKISEDRAKAESRLRAANRRVLELEGVVLEKQGQLDQVGEENIKVAEMEHHLLESSKEVQAIRLERDMHASASDVLQATVASLEGDLRQAADKNAKLLKAFEDHEENNRHAVEKLRKLLENSKTSEAALRDELDALREENLHLSIAGDCGDSDSNTYNRLHQERAAGSDGQSRSQSLTGGFLHAFYGEQVVEAPQPEKSDKMLAFELTETLRRKEEELEYLREKLEQQKNDRERAIDKGLMERELEAAKKQAGVARSTVESTAALGEDILSGAYARREEQATIEIAELKARLAKAEAQVHKVERENKKVLKMWDATRARLLEAERADWSGEGDQPPPHISTSSKDLNSEEVVVQLGANVARVSLAQLVAPTTNESEQKGDTLHENPVSVSSTPATALETNGAVDGVIADGDCSDDNDTDDVMAVAIADVEEDCRLLREQKRELQDLCESLKSKLKDLADRLGKVQGSFEQERQGKQEVERALEERRELLSKATLAVAEHSMALHEAQEGTEKVKAELELERQQTGKLRLNLKEMDALNSSLEAGLEATKISLEVMTTANSAAVAAAERNAFQADRNALQAERNACWSNTEGMRAEEAISRRYLADEAAAKTVAALSVELEKSENENRRRRQEAKEHAEQMKEFRQCVAERARLEKEVARQHQVMLDMRQKAASDATIIEELKLQVVLLDQMRKEVLRLEDKMERIQKEIATTKASLDASKKQLKIAEHQLREKTSLSRNLWAALVGAIFVVDDWCSGPLLAWRDTDPAATPAVLPKPPFEARGVDAIMKLRKTAPCGGDAQVEAAQVEAAQVEAATSIPTLPPERARTEADTILSIHDRLQGQRPKDIKAWLDFRVQIVAAMDHGDRVDSARSEQLLLDSICNQRAAQILNMEEALRKLDATRAALQEEHDAVCAVKEELSKTVLKQDEALLDNSRELLRYAALKVDHEAEVRQHEKVAKCLREAEVSIKRLDIKLDRALGVAAMAENAAKEAEIVRDAAVAEREDAVHEAKVIRETMKRGEEQAERVQKQLHDLVRADETRLATNKQVATEVAYGDFTEEVGLQTRFLCPELTMRQLGRRRLSAAKNLAPESVGRVVPALKHVLPQHFGTKRFGVTSYLACGDQLHEDEEGERKTWQRASCSASSKINGGLSPCEISRPRAVYSRTTGCKTLKITHDGPWPSPATEHLERSRTQAQHHQQEDSVLGARSSNPDKTNRWSFGWDSVALPMIA
eukprot:g12116.t2